MSLLKQVTLDKANRRKDRSVSITFITSLEQSSNEFMEIDSALSQTGTIYFKPEGQLTEQEISEIEAVNIPVEGKSKSQKLRNVLYVLYTQKDCSDKNKAVYLDFKEFYANELEKIIQHYKDKLES